MKKLRIIILLNILFSYSKNLLAYPNFISFGYNSCLTCHYNPYGNGPLTDYGRAVSATVISDRIIHKKEKTEEIIAKNSGFLYMKAFNNIIRPSINYRGLRLGKGYNKKAGKYETIHMQADINTVIRIKSNDKYIISLSYGYAPTPKSLKNSKQGNYRSREHYLGIRPSKSYGIYMGMMDKVFGIRVPDHVVFSRSITELSQNDQTHGVLLHLSKNNFEIGLHTFIGSLFQDNDLRQKGFSLKVEHNSSHTLKPGFSLLKSKSKYFDLSMQAIHIKYAFLKSSSILFEFGHKRKEIISSKQTNNTIYSLMQNHILLKRGLFALVNFEYLKLNTNSKNDTLRFGPGMQYFPFQGIEFRFDLYNTKTFSETSASKDSWDFAGQLHIWL